MPSDDFQRLGSRGPRRFRIFVRLLVPPFLFFGITAFVSATTLERTILAGDENSLPNDAPSQRIDALGPSSPFNFVGGVSIQSGGSSFTGSASALSPEWVLTAGHNLDTDDDGAVDDDLSATFHLPDFGQFSVAAFHVQPGFAGFSNDIHHDLGLMRLAEPLPADLHFPGFSTGLSLGDTIALAGFGRSGYGNYGYTTSASLTHRRIGENTIETFTMGDTGGPELFRYTFGHPDTAGEPGGSLGNDIETIIGPGDSGGPALVEADGVYLLAGVNTFTEGYGGRFGDIGGGIVLEPYHDWIGETTGLAIPEPTAVALLAGIVFFFVAVFRRRRRPAAGTDGRLIGPHAPPSRWER